MVRSVFPSRQPRRRSLLHNTILTAGPGGAKNPLPGSLAARDNEIRQRLTGNTILTSSAVGPPKPSKSRKRESLKVDIDTPPNATLAVGTDENKVTVKRPTKNDLEETKGLIFGNRFPVDNKFMKGAGRQIIIDQAVKIAKGEIEKFTEKDDVVFLGGHIFSSNTAEFVSRALKVQTREEFKELSEDARDPNLSDLNNTQFSAVMSIARSNVLKGPITNQTPHEEVLDRLGPSLRMLDERVSRRSRSVGDSIMVNPGRNVVDDEDE